MRNDFIPHSAFLIPNPEEPIMYHIHPLNKISAKGTELLTADYMTFARDSSFLKML